MNLTSLSLPVLCLTLAGCGGAHPSDDDYFVSSTSNDVVRPSTAGAPAVPASAQRLVTVTNDRDASVNAIDLKLDGAGNPVAIIYSKGATGSQQEFTSAQIGSGYGVVLEQQNGIDAVQLRGQIDASTGTGLAALRYISNGATGTYAECPMRINRSASGVWSVANVYTGQPVSTIQTVTWSLGITNFTGICRQ